MLSVAQVQAIRTLYVDGRTRAAVPGCTRNELAKTYGVTLRTITRVCAGLTRRHKKKGRTRKV